MASVRLPSLLSTVCRSSEVYHSALRTARAAQRMRAYHPARRLQQEHYPQRYGTANEPPPHLGGGKGIGPSTKQKQSSETKESARASEKQEPDSEQPAPKDEKEAKPAEQSSNEAKKEPTTVDGQITSAAVTDPMLDAGEATPSQAPPDAIKTPDANALDTILNSVPNPQEHAEQQQNSEDEDAHAEEHPDKTFDEHSPPIKAPHMEAPRYVHHFDTYGLVKRLKEGGWEEKQAITVMKAMRVILADQTDLAKEALVSKSQLENEGYLFKAACAELKTEVTTRRKSEQQKMRTERTQLQHEVDIISQRLGQETSALKDELKGMFDDRKMAVRNEQRDMESKLQQLNYQITVNLQSDAKTEVEGVRWIMTRRVILTLGIVVLMIVASLKAAANAEAAKAANKPGKPTLASGGTQTEGMEGSEGGRATGGSGQGYSGEGSNAGYESSGYQR